MKKIQAYISPYHIKLITAYSFMFNQSKSKTGGNIIKDFFDNMSDDDKKKLIELFNGLSESQKISPSVYFNKL
jgi:hypothetical protein